MGKSTHESASGQSTTQQSLIIQTIRDKNAISRRIGFIECHIHILMLIQRFIILGQSSYSVGLHFGSSDSNPPGIVSCDERTSQYP